MRVRINSLENYKHIHLIGIGGVSMSAIAETLHTWGYKVTGSDAAQSDYTDKLVKSGVKVTIGHDLTNPKNADLIIFKVFLT